MREINQEVVEKIKRIKVVLTDVDGVLTDGGMYYSADGLIIKKFSVKDGMGSGLLRKAGFKVGLISSDTNSINRIRAERLQFDYIYYGIPDKKAVLDEICMASGFEYENIAFIGDDLNDIGILQEVGFSACPKDAVETIRKIVDYRCQKRGGCGAYREIADLIMKHHGLEQKFQFH